MAYFANTAAAQTHLSLYFGLTVTMVVADLDLAEASLKRMGPFIGTRYSSTQPDDFPRSITLEGDTEGVVPEAVMDFIALRAASLALSDEMTAVTSNSMGIEDIRLTEAYKRPKFSKVEVYLRNRMEELRKYQRRTGEVY